MHIRPYTPADWPAVWALLEPVFRAGETYAIPRDIPEEAARCYWTAPAKEVHVACHGDAILGTYYLRPNQEGPGSHVSNCGYVVGEAARGRGVASAMCRHSLQEARARGFRSMQFNCVVSTNAGAVRLWKKHGFEIVGTLPEAFEHPAEGLVDAYVMWRSLEG